ncbi:MAG: permease [Candidatus Cloacimonadales bacterium]
MSILYIITALLFLLSLLKDRQKSLKALQIAWKKFRNIIPAFMTMLILVSIILYLLPAELILKYLGTENIYSGLSLAAILGSITMMPGFIAYPLSGILLQQGVPYAVLGAFSTTLMMVGIATFPLEQKFLGTKVTIVRNLLGFIIAIIIALVIGWAYGEFSL